MNSDPEIKNIFGEMINSYISNYKNISIDSLYKIGLMLIEKGANPNAEHSLNKISGYTPLMVAAEMNDPILFKAMLENGGNLEKKCTYLDKKNLQVNSIEVAHNFRSTEVLEVIAQHLNSKK